MARKNGKTTLAATEALDLFFLDGEIGAEIYCAATKRDQAKICWNEVRAQIARQPSLRNRVEIFKTFSTIKQRGGESVIKALGSDSDTEDGLNPLLGIIDEYHAHKTADMVNVLESGMGSREQPLIYIITTAGTNRNGPCYQEERELAVRTLAGEGPEDYFCIIYTLDEGDEWDDPKVWIKANPNLPGRYVGKEPGDQSLWIFILSQWSHARVGDQESQQIQGSGCVRSLSENLGGYLWLS